MKLFTVLCCCALLIMAAAGTSSARVATGNLEGTVLDAAGRAISGATVTIQTSDGTHPHATRTDVSGHFEFARFAVGQYDLRAYMDGSYSEWARRIAIRSKQPTSVTLQIKSSITVLVKP
jgi:hypothetical protein